MKTFCFFKASLRRVNNAALSSLKCATKPILGHIFCFSIRQRHTCTRPEKFENTALFLRLDPTIHANQSRKWSFSKTLFHLQEFKNADFSFSFGVFTVLLHGGG